MIRNGMFDPCAIDFLMTAEREMRDDNPDSEEMPETLVDDIEGIVTALGHKKKVDPFSEKGRIPSLKIEPVKSGRDDVWHKQSQRDHILPGCGVTLFIGGTGSGKTCLVSNLLGKKELLKGYWEPKNIYIFALSPCKMLMDIIKPKKRNIITEDNPALIKTIVDEQKKKAMTEGLENAPRVLIICDDVAQSKSFLRHPILTELAFASTHSKISVWLTSQSYTQIPRHVRINCHYLVLMHGARRSEIDRFMDEYESPFITKKQMLGMIKFALMEKYSFIYVDNCIPDKTKQFRKSFETILQLKAR